MLQLRDKSSDIRRFYADAVMVQDLARAAGVAFIVNDRVDIALAMDADGVHVGEDDLPVEATRRLVGPQSSSARRRAVSRRRGRRSRRARIISASAPSTRPATRR